MQNLTDFVDLTKRIPAEFTSSWGASITIGAGIRNVYNGMEDIIKTVARRVDAYVPDGDQWHQELLDQMAAASPTRPALVSREAYQNLTSLKSFRQVVNHNYGSAIKQEKVMENLVLLNETYGPFVLDIRAFIDAMSTQLRPDRPSFNEE
jgi:hypothetical protein